jgi:Ca2+-binding RTX toxin-like protein
MEALDPRTLFDVDVEFEHVALPTTGNTPISGAPVQIQVDMKNVGSSAFNVPFTVGVQLLEYPIGTTQDRLILPYGDADAIQLGSGVFNQMMPGNGPVQTLTINTTVPNTVHAGTYALLVKVDTQSQLSETNKGNNEGGILDVAVIGSDGTMSLSATGGPDTMTLTRTTVNKHPHVTVQVLDRSADYSLGAVQKFDVNMGDGDDVFVATGLLPNILVDGHDGNDRLIGAEGNDTIIGGANKDTLMGGGGNDRLNGNGGNDRLFGEAGADRLYGYDGVDYLDGGSSGDRLEGGAGADVMVGQSGDDKFFAKDGVVDQLFGSTGNDSAHMDASDVISSVETTVTT